MDATYEKACTLFCFLTADSESTKRDIVEHFNVSEERVRVIYLDVILYLGKLLIEARRVRCVLCLNHGSVSVVLFYCRGYA